MSSILVAPPYAPGIYIDHEGDEAIKHPDGRWYLFFKDVGWREVEPRDAWIVEYYAEEKGGWKKK
jgi:hypothetical protein